LGNDLITNAISFFLALILIIIDLYISHSEEGT